MDGVIEEVSFQKSLIAKPRFVVVDTVVQSRTFLIVESAIPKQRDIALLIS